MRRNLISHWLISLIEYRAQARAWIQGGKSPSAYTRRQRAVYARENLQKARRCAGHFVGSIKEWRWLNRRELGMESEVAS